MEGIDIKPLVDKKDVLPYLKVRNENYLTLVYGYDYLQNEKYKRLMKQKNVYHKRQLSLKMHELAEQLLTIPLHDISEQNEQYKQLVATILFTERTQETIDPRL
jgi:hypothetical protein